MARSSPVFVCGECSGETLKWQGQCPQCAAWNSLEHRAAAARAPAAGGRAAPRTLNAEPTSAETRLGTGQGELDRVLGGGIVAGSVTLLGGDPGIGKSTLLLQVASHIAGSHRVLYASGKSLNRRWARGPGG
jgi:DNA repair protein RadA/Sms